MEVQCQSRWSSGRGIALRVWTLAPPISGARWEPASKVTRCSRGGLGTSSWEYSQHRFESVSPAFRISCASGKDLSDFCSSKPTCKYAKSWYLAVGGEAAGHPGGTWAPAALLRADGESVVPGQLQICKPPDSGQMGAWSRVERAWQARSLTGLSAWGDPRAPAHSWARSWDFQSHVWKVFCVG